MLPRLLLPPLTPPPLLLGMPLRLLVMPPLLRATLPLR